ncbi:unnamed protein product [Lactuca saligna]|uniref:TF-B3 domain-containing protein n=1 Tax=Lactuca saligna TaxID=75948 RepID=A0AA35YC42_LACSI|nr:unnamed protein product [Lactuca saligna]
MGDHIMISCPMAMEIMESILNWCEIMSEKFSSVMDMLLFISRWSGDKKKQRQVRAATNIPLSQFQPSALCKIMALRPLPSFYKILLDRSAPRLDLPSAFIRRHLENKIPENPILRSRNGGYKWRLKIKKEGEIYCFTDGWSDVVEDSDLGFGDFLVFWLVDESTFKFSIFSPNGCERDFPSQIQVENDDHDEVEEQEAEKEEEEVEVEDGVEDDEEEAAEAEEEDEDEDEDEEEEESDEEEEEEDDIFDDGGVDEEDAGDEDDDGDGGGDVDVDGDNGDPYFMTIMSKSHTMSMRLPSEFARLARIDAERSVIMKNIDGQEWKIRLLSDSKRYYLSAGWSEFRRVNELCEGDKCVFKFIKSEDKLCLARVTKKRVQSKQPPAVEVLKKRSRGQLPPPRVEVQPKQSTGKAQAPVAEVLKRSSGKPPQPRVVVESKDDGREVVNEKQPAGKVRAAAEVSKRPRGRPPRVDKKGQSKKPADKAPAVEVSKRLRGRPPRVEVVVEKKGRSKKPADKAPAAEISKRLRGRPPRVELVVEGKGRSKKPVGKAPAAEVSKMLKRRPPRVEVVVEKKVQSKKSASKAPADEVLKRKRGRPSHVEVEGKEEGGKLVVKRSPGRPSKRKRGRPASQRLMMLSK